MIKRNTSYHSGIRSQKGFTLIGWIVVLAIFLFFAYLAVIISPYVISNNTMNQILVSLKEEPGITLKTKREIQRLINNRLTINSIRDMPIENFEIVKEDNKVVVYLDYDDKIHFVGNTYIVIEREKSVELIRN